MDTEYIKAIKNQLLGNLPGWEAQKEMSPIKSARYRESNIDAKKAAVMLLIHPNASGQLSLFYIKRTNHNPQDKHGGQISFPGGQVDHADLNYNHTSLRETNEEIGVIAADINLLGQLSSIYVFASNFFVQPVVGYLPYNPKLILQKSEVQYTIQMPINELQDPNTLKNKDFKFGEFNVKDMPYFDLNGEVLWGATAMITSEFLAVIDAV